MTAQFHENLILEGEKTTMAFCPPIPIDHPGVRVLDAEEMQEGIRAGVIPNIVFSTACWREYIGTWELRDGKFYLNEVQGRFRINEPLFADWFTGVLRIPTGNRLHYVHMGFGSVYEFETHIKIENGLVMEERHIDNRGKDVNSWELGWKNLPGGENRFDGDNL
jgi:hypothetical protein